MTNALRTALENVCADLERFDPSAPSLHFARGLLSGKREPKRHARSAEMIAMRERGATYAEIAIALGCNIHTAIRYTQHVPKPPKPPKLPKPPKPQASPEMVTDYESGLSLGEVAQKHGRGVQTVRNWLIRAGVTIRPKGPKHSIDTDRVERIMQMNADGMNLQQIGNALGISRERVRQLVIKGGRKADWIEHVGKLTFEQQEAIDLYRDGMSLALASNKAGFHPDTFKKHLAAAGVEVRPSQKYLRRKEKADQKAAQVARLYQEGLSGKEIAAQLGFNHPERVYHYLARAGVPARDPKRGKVLS